MAGLPRAAFAELVGTFTFFTMGIGAAVASVSGANLDLLGVAVANGIALSAMVAVFGGISGGHFNPAVTFSVLLAGRIEPVRAGVYLIAQLVGAVFAGLLLKQLYVPAEYLDSNVGTPAIGVGVSIGRAILVEAVLAFFLVLVVWGTGVHRRGAGVAPFAIGLAVLVGTLVGGPLTGAAMNPARHLGPALASGFWADWWVWWVGPLFGGAVAGLLYSAVFLDPDDDTVMPALAAGASPIEDGTR